MSLASGAVRLAVLLLPANLRDRYREQWGSDLRDAAEAGIPQHEIATGALAFAATVSRPLPWSWPADPAPAVVESRSRLAAALSLSAALLGLAGFATVISGSGPTGIVAYDLLLDMVDSLLIAHMVVAPIVALTIVSRTKATNPRVRLALWLLVLPVLAPIGQRFVDGYAHMVGDSVLGRGSVAYLLGAVVVVVALRLLWVGLRRPSVPARASSPATLACALAVLAAGALGWGQAVLAWISGNPIAARWSWEPGTAMTIDADGTVDEWKIYPTQADYEQWLAFEAQYAMFANVAVVAYAAAVVALVVALVIIARSIGIRPAALAAVAVAMLLIGNAALLSFLQWASAAPAVGPDLLLAIGRVLLVAVILYAVGEVRFERRTLARLRHRHDVESSVELV